MKTESGSKDISFTLPPLAFLVRGNPKRYGTPPTVRTRLLVYRDKSAKEYELVGTLDETGPLAVEQILNSKISKIHTR